MREETKHKLLACMAYAFADSRNLKRTDYVEGFMAGVATIEKMQDLEAGGKSELQIAEFIHGCVLDCKAGAGPKHPKTKIPPKQNPECN